MLTERQRQILDCIEGHIARTGTGPSYREIGKLTGISSMGTIHKVVAQLVSRRFIRRLRNRARAIEVLKPQTHLNPEYQRGIEEGLRLAQEREPGERLAMVS